MQVTPVTARCGEIWQRHPAIVLGISPFNSYFSRIRIEQLIRWSLRYSRQVYCYVPDAASAWNLIATGTEPARAHKLAAKQGRYLRNKILQAWRNVGLSGARADRLLDARALQHRPAYAMRLAEVQQRHDSDPAFRELCLAATAAVLGSRGAGDVADPSTAVNYLLAEFPLFTHAEEIIDQAVAAFVYRQCPSVVAKVLAATPPASRHTAFVCADCLITAPRPSAPAALRR